MKAFYISSLRVIYSLTLLLVLFVTFVFNYIVGPLAAKGYSIFSWQNLLLLLVAVSLLASLLLSFRSSRWFLLGTPALLAMFGLIGLILFQPALITTHTASPTGAIQNAAAVNIPQNLERTDYLDARKIILGDGWNAMSGPCGQVGKNTCSSFPEIDSCSGVGKGYCAMVFAKQDQCLYVTTSGGEPTVDGGDTRVETVKSRPGPCSKN